MLKDGKVNVIFLRFKYNQKQLSSVKSMPHTIL